MTNKTSEIIKVLEKSKPREVLKPSQRRVFDALVYTGLLDCAGNRTVEGNSILNEYKTAVLTYGPSKIEIIPANKEGHEKYTFRVRRTDETVEDAIAKNLNLTSKIEPKKETSTLEEETKRENYSPAQPKSDTVPAPIRNTKLGEYVSGIVRERKAFSSSKESDGKIKIKTNLPFGRTIEETSRLNAIANYIKADINIQRGEPEMGKKDVITQSTLYIMKIRNPNNFIGPEKLNATIVSEKVARRGNVSKFARNKPMTIEIDSHSEKETVVKLLNALEEGFNPIKKKV